MSSIAQTQPRTGRRNFNLRAYLAGTAATVALIGAVVIAFGSLGAYVAFNGLPIGGSDADAQTSSIAVDPVAAPQNTARQRGAQNVGAADVRRDPGSQSAGGSGANSAATEASQAPTAPTTTAGAPPDTGTEAPVSASGPEQTATPSPTQGGPSDNPPSAGIPTPHVTTPDSVGGTVGTVEQTLQDVGVNVPLNDAGAAVDDVAGLVGGN